MESEALRLQLSRCAESLDDPTRARGELQRLRELGGAEAEFAAALFDIELARRGDADSRTHLATHAGVLLTFWRDGSGDALANRTPLLERLWLSLAPMLVQFERKRLELALALCWKVRGDSEALREAIEALEPQGQRHVEFARCLYYLELTRRGDEASREQFSARVRLLSDAYRDVALANDLIGPDPGLRILWGELQPYLEDFFDSMEAEAAPTQEPTRKVKNPLLGEKPPKPPPPPPPSVPTRAPVEEELSVELEEVTEAPPPPPELDAEILIDDDAGPDAATQAFWSYAFASLRAVGSDSTRMRMLASESKEDRARLATFLDGLKAHLEVPEARAFGALTRLTLAAQMKEKTLFGQHNPRRAEALEAALSMLSTDGAAAGRAAVWFASDGPVTDAALVAGLELLVPFLAFCARTALDPLKPETVKRYLAL